MNEINDPTLLIVTPEKGGAKFTIGIFIVFCLLILIWILSAQHSIESTVPLSLTTTESNSAKLIKALSQQKAQVVLVGTSVMDRIDPRFFTIPQVANLAIPGGSSGTGLEIILRGQMHPRVVYIETNYVANVPNAELLSQTTGDLTSWMLRGAVKPLRYILSGERKRMSQEQALSETEDLLKMRPIEYNNAELIQKGADWYLSEAAKLELTSPQPMVKRIRQITAEFETKGIQVFYVHIPMSAPYEQTEFFKGNRLAVAGNANYNCANCLDLTKLVDISQLRWPDGVHLDDRSAALVARALEAHITSVLIF